MFLFVLVFLNFSAFSLQPCETDTQFICVCLETCVLHWELTSGLARPEGWSQLYNSPQCSSLFFVVVITKVLVASIAIHSLQEFVCFAFVVYSYSTSVFYKRLNLVSYSTWLRSHQRQFQYTFTYYNLERKVMNIVYLIMEYTLKIIIEKC